MLVKVSVTEAKKNVGWIGRSVILNTERIKFLEANGSVSQFKYDTNIRNSRGVPDTLVTASTVATINNAMKSSLLTATMYLPVFPNDVTTATPLVKYILYGDFAYGFADPLSATTRSYVYLNEGTRMRRVLVNLSIDEIIDYTAYATTTLH